LIHVPANATVVLMHQPISFRYGIEGTCAVARTVLQREPMDGALFVFRNKAGHMLRILYYDGSGFWLCTKRLSRGCFTAWPRGDGTALASALLVRELQVLLWGGDIAGCRFPALWRQVTEGPVGQPVGQQS
jgi:transposase